MCYNIEALCNVNHEDFTMMMKCLSRETVHFAVNNHTSNHNVIESVIFIQGGPKVGIHFIV
jgi:hypothetical protein